jgi:hypothetical protein
MTREPGFDSRRWQEIVFCPQTGSEAHSILYSIGAGVIFPGCKAAGTWSWSLASIWCRVRGATSTFSYMFSCRGNSLSTGAALPFSFHWVESGFVFFLNTVPTTPVQCSAVQWRWYTGAWVRCAPVCWVLPTVWGIILIKKSVLLNKYIYDYDDWNNENN